jgi:hypothetical protein
MSKVATIKADPFISMLERIALSPEANVENIERLYALRERDIARNAEEAFNVAMLELRGELMPVLKNKQNNQTNSHYADLEAIQKVAHPLLEKYGFYDRYEDDYPAPNTVGTTCEIVHVRGHSKRNRVQFELDDKGIKGTVNKTSPHAAASSMTYGQRLSLCRAIGIRITKDDDGNLAGAKFIDDASIKAIRDLIEETKADESRYLEMLGVARVENILVKDYPTALNALLKKRQKIGAASS